MTETRPTSVELRETILTTWAWPRVRAFFEREPRAQSVLFVVGQFWADEADDAVHGELLGCIDPSPSWPACARYSNNPIGDADAAEENADAEGFADDAFAAQREAWMAIDASFPIEARFLDDNSEMIVAFASFCAEGASQEDPYSVAFHPYALFRRDSDEAAIVGTMTRSEWENCWDVVDEELTRLEHDVHSFADLNPTPSPPKAGGNLVTLLLALVVAAAILFAALR